MTEPTQPPVPPAPPVPQYGEYTPAGYIAPQQPVAYGHPLTPVHPSGRRRRVWDVVLTIVFLALGMIGMLFGLIYGWIFSNPDLLDQALTQQGVDGFHGSVGPSSAVLLVSHLGLYLVALGLSIFLLITRRIAFWVPLAAGVIAAIIFWVTVMTVLFSDPDLIAQLSSRS